MMDAADRTPDEQAILNEYESKIDRSYEVWDRFVLKGTFLNWEDAVLAGSEQWLGSPSIHDCRVVRVTPEMDSIEAQDVGTLRFMTTSTVIVTRTHARLGELQPGRTIELKPSSDFAEVVSYKPFNPTKTVWNNWPSTRLAS